MASEIKILSFVEQDFEDLELWYPIYRLREAGCVVHLAGMEKGAVYKGKYGVPATADMSIADADEKNYQGLLVPGGWAPDKLRRYDKVLALTRAFHEAQKPIGHICHAGWVLISANIIKGYTVTGTPGIKDDLINAGGIWVDQPAVADRHIISAQRPPDLPAYMKLYLAALGIK